MLASSRIPESLNGAAFAPICGRFLHLVLIFVFLFLYFPEFFLFLVCSAVSLVVPERIWLAKVTEMPAAFRYFYFLIFIFCRIGLESHAGDFFMDDFSDP